MLSALLFGFAIIIAVSVVVPAVIVGGEILARLRIERQFPFDALAACRASGAQLSPPVQCQISPAAILTTNASSVVLKKNAITPWMSASRRMALERMVTSEV